MMFANRRNTGDCLGSTATVEHQTESFAEECHAFGRNRNGAGAGEAAVPAGGEAARANRGAGAAGEMEPPFAPIEAGAAEDAA